MVVDYDLHTEINSILEGVAKKLDILDFDIEFNLHSEKGDGFLGEFFMGNVTDKENNKKIHVAIKKAVDDLGRIRKYLDIPLAYKNENNFYAIVFDALNRFQIQRGVKVTFTAVPKYFLGSTVLYKESVVMENIMEEGFRLHDKSQQLTTEQVRFVFEMYGKFHALSLAYKDQNYKDYKKVVSSLGDFYITMRELHDWGITLKKDGEALLNYIESKGLDDIARKFKPMADNLWEIYRDVCIYKGEYSAVIHGDCWSNNMMFKYDKSGKLTDMRMLDFQLCRDSTPVYDLSYFLYSGGSKEHFDQLDHYLDIYYHNFSNFAKELGSDPEKIYPMAELKKDWKNYSKFGIIMALSICRIKVLKKEEIAEMATGEKEYDPSNVKEDDQKKSDNFFYKLGTDIITHACEYGIL